MLLSTLLLSLLSLVAAQVSDFAVFVYNGDDDASFSFALQAVRSTGDLYFHLSGPAANSWIAVGTGVKMEDSLMLIAYPDSSNTGVTISPRYATGHTEPVYQSNITVDQLGVNTVTTYGKSNIIANGVCKGCVTFKDGGSIDLTSTAQPFIFAVGPPFPPLASNSKSAGLTEHSFVGRFTMDMTAATVQSDGRLPGGPFDVKKSASEATNTKTTFDPAPHIHGLVMAVVFVLLLPTGSLVLRVWNRVKYHAIFQIIGLVLFLMAFAGGIVVSTKYNRSKHFDSAHQIVGILLALAFITQLALGIMHHRVYKKEQRKTIRGWIHLYLGPTIIFVGLINGILGFMLAGNGFIAIPYCIGIVIVGIIYSCIRFFSWRRRKRNAAFKSEGPEGYQYPQFGNAPAPNYERQADYYPPRSYPGQDVPLERYTSSSNVPQVGMPAQEPRSMI